MIAEIVTLVTLNVNSPASYTLCRQTRFNYKKSTACASIAQAVL